MKPATYGRLKRLWHVTVSRTDNGDIHGIDVDGYYDPRHPLTNETVANAAKWKARLNAGLEFAQRELFVVTEIKLVEV